MFPSHFSSICAFILPSTEKVFFTLWTDVNGTFFNEANHKNCIEIFVPENCIEIFVGHFWSKIRLANITIWWHDFRNKTFLKWKLSNNVLIKNWSPKLKAFLPSCYPFLHILHLIVFFPAWTDFICAIILLLAENV